MTNPYEPGAEPTIVANATAVFASNTLWTWLNIGALVVAAGVDSLGAFENAVSIATLTRSEGMLVFQILLGLQGVGALLMLPVNVIAWLIWQYRAANNALAFSAAGPAKTMFGAARKFDFGPGTSLVWWFVPFANLLMPYRVVLAIWTASHAPLGPTPSLEPRLQTWWGLWLVSNISANFAFRVTGVEPSLEASLLWLVSNAVGVGAAIAAALLVRAINDTQERAGKAISPSPALPA